MQLLWRAIPLTVAAFATASIGWMFQKLRLEWTRNDSWGFTVTVASVVIPIFLVLIWLAVYVMWGIAREGLRGTGPGHPSPPGPGGIS
jgi:heme/copper-type cytochrome/quinol oxidase subunit 2